MAEVRGGNLVESRQGLATSERLAGRLWLVALSLRAAVGRAPLRLLVCGKVDMLVFVDFDSLAYRARFDKLIDVSPKAWPDLSLAILMVCCCEVL